MLLGADFLPLLVGLLSTLVLEAGSFLFTETLVGLFFHSSNDQLLLLGGSAWKAELSNRTLAVSVAATVGARIQMKIQIRSLQCCNLEGQID